jgi:hypothetical protein
MATIAELLAEGFKNIAPADTRLFASTLFGNRAPITEKDFTPQELAGIQSVVGEAQKRGSKGDVQYKDYAKFSGENARAEYDPQIATRTTLGRFNYAQNPDGTLRVTDRYDFANEARNSAIAAYQQMNPVQKALTVAKNTFLDNPMKWPTNAGNELANAYIGNEGRDVNININPQELAKQLRK